MTGSELIRAIKRKFRVTTDVDLGEKLGIRNTTIQEWKNRPKITPRQAANLIAKAYDSSAKQVQITTIRTLVEFFPLKRFNSLQGAAQELFSTEGKGGKKHPYREGLKQELRESKGVYVFFDSRGRAIYAGKAKKQFLWNEMRSAFNRDRGRVQKIKRVRHPERHVQYRKSDEHTRQIVEYAVPLHEIAAYFSAYRVADGMIDDLEALLVRSFSNDLLNVKAERFGKTRLRAV